MSHSIIYSGLDAEHLDKSKLMQGIKLNSYLKGVFKYAIQILAKNERTIYTGRTYKMLMLDTLTPFPLNFSLPSATPPTASYLLLRLPACSLAPSSDFELWPIFWKTLSTPPVV